MKLRIKEIRENSYLLQRQLAEYLNCTQQTYSRYETGDLEPSLPVMAKLARFYDTSVDYLLGLTDDKIQHWNSENTKSKEAIEDNKHKEFIISMKTGVPKPKNRKNRVLLPKE